MHVNMQRDSSMIFSMQASTVCYEHVKLASRYLREQFGLRYNGFAILLCMLEAARSIGVAELADYLMLSKGSVLALLLALEDGGHVVKAGSDEDGRAMACGLSKGGRAVVSEASRGVSDLLVKTFLTSLPMEEFELFANIDAGTTALRGHDVTGFGATAPGTLALRERGYLFPSGHFVWWRVVVERWKACAREKCGMSFDEFRILELVDSLGGMVLKDVADSLRLQRSGLSIYKGNLVKAGLLLERPDPFDGRSTMVRCTPEGGRLVAGRRGEFDAVMRAGHVGLGPAQEILLNAWYMRMYSNMRAAS